jgi:hypothetical protein
MDPYTDDAAGDPDNDGSSNIWEFRSGRDPCNPDTDGDGLCDRFIAVGSTCFDGEMNHGTDSTNPDTDGDGLTDGDEVSVYSTNPLDPDSDGDGYSDGAEIAAGTDPNDPLSYPAPSQHLINYQGRLTDSVGVAVADTVDMTFRIFDVLSGGTELWSESQSDVLVQAGIYNVILGSVTVLDPDIFSTTALYLEVEVNGETLSPRARITSVPFAIQADRAFGGRMEMDSRTLTIAAPSSSVTVHVSFNRAFSSPPVVLVSPLEGKIGGVGFVVIAVSNVTATGFDVTFESNTGAGASGTSSFSYQAFGN